MGIDRSQRITFEQVADLYEETRSDYPQELIDDILEWSDMPADGRILEIGCGPGNATIPLAQRGYHLLGIELGEQLATMAAANCSPYPNVRILNMAFEDWELEENAFDLAVAADAFHWIPPEFGYPQVARALKPSGSAAFFWRAPVDPDTEWSQAIAEVYERVAPQFPNPDRRFTVEWLVGIIKKNFDSSGCYDNLRHKEYRWSETVSSDEYIKGLRTFSMHQGIDEQLRNQLYQQIKGVIDAFGGRLPIPQAVVLFHARVRK